MAATKEQEQKALEKIKKIVTDLGEDSYISMAFEGCFEIAEGNIENDFGCSMKQRAESSAAEAAKYKEMYESAVKDYEAEKRTVEELEQKVLTLEEAGAIKAILIDSKTEAIRRTEESARKIVEFADNPDSAEFKQAVQDITNSWLRKAKNLSRGFLILCFRRSRADEKVQSKRERTFQPVFDVR
mgnify:CR=1 FL=1